MTTAIQPDQGFQHDGTTPRPPLTGSVVYLVMNLGVGIAGFVTLVTLFAVGLGTAIIWVGLPVLALAVLLCRGGAQVERARVYALLDTYIAAPHSPLPETGRWKARFRDGGTWRSLAYFLLLLPIGIVEFTMMVALWASSLGLLFLPVYFRFLPTGSYRLWDWDRPVLVIDSTVEALPFTALGVLVLAVTLVTTRWLARVHARFARALLGPVLTTAVGR
ncbi:sensor domain-containing protein [Actinokineospora fastidiosa]|uniref:sensor domain-containing protein n=1 Tax=Actinokineospora fastidiosa TaxID=1816 RepID=UPI0016716FDF|nr:sensor domain-containing protein [Actinokineospora fastidiosa]